MFVFFSNRLGCLGSLAVSAVLSLILIFAMRACNRPPSQTRPAGEWSVYQPGTRGDDVSHGTGARPSVARQ